LEHYFLNRITVAISTALLSACASQPKPATAPSAFVPATAVVVGSPAPSAPAPAPAASPGGAPATASFTPDPDLVKQGYKVQNYHGQPMYCHSEQITGSALSRKVCLTAEQIRARTDNARELMNTRHSDTTCAQMKCN
jgi:hypothetical protein